MTIKFICQLDNSKSMRFIVKEIGEFSLNKWITNPLIYFFMLLPSEGGKFSHKACGIRFGKTVLRTNFFSKLNCSQPTKFRRELSLGSQILLDARGTSALIMP